MRIPCYTNSRGPFPPDFDYRNPEYFGAPTPDTPEVVVVGDWPEVVAAYEAQGTTVHKVKGIRSDGEVEPIEATEPTAPAKPSKAKAAE